MNKKEQERTKVGQYYARIERGKVIIETEGRTQEEADRLSMAYYGFTGLVHTINPAKIATFSKKDIRAIRGFSAEKRLALQKERKQLWRRLHEIAQSLQYRVQSYPVSYGEKTVRVGCTRVPRRLFDKLARRIRG